MNASHAREAGRQEEHPDAHSADSPGAPAQRRRRRRRRAPEAWPFLAWPIPPIRSDAARRVAEWFGLPLAGDPALPPPPLPPGLVLPAPGRILLVCGPSGAGKSTLLRRLVCKAPAAPGAPLVLDVARTQLRRVPCVDQLGTDVQFSLGLLSRVGLGEAATCLCLPDELSDGQRWRLRLAVCLARAMRQRPDGNGRRRAAVLCADEFCATLDRVSAAVVARCLRRTVDRLARVGLPLSAAVATSHDDLSPALLPDMEARCDFGTVSVVAATRRAG